jgi:hypothetical protein
MKPAISIVWELHVNSLLLPRRHLGKASVHIIPGYIGYDDDESVAHYSEHPDIRRLIGPIEKDQARELAERLCEALREAGCEVEFLDVVDD